MIACVNMQDGHRVGQSLGFLPALAAALPAVQGIFKGAAGSDANDAFFNFAQGSEMLSAQTKKTAITLGFVVGGLVVAGLIFYAVKG